MTMPTGVELLHDISGARWVVDALRPWLRSGRVLVTSVVPVGYAAYVRIDHGGEPVDEDAGEVPEFEGELPDELMRPLLQVLGAHTPSRDTCWFCIWDGYGALWDSAERDSLRVAPRLRGEGRDYFVFRGPLSAANAFAFDGWAQPPNLWWPDDRAWCVGTEIDLNSTFVAGTGGLIDEVLRAMPEAASVVDGNEAAS